jgi:serine/threonine-protein kinase
VWLGVHLALGVNVAVKFMEPTLAQSAEYASFEREARAAAQLRSEHAVRIYDHGLARGGRPYLVMEYLDGETIGRRLARERRLPARDVVAIVGDVARALGEAHGRGIVHRDVKPDNIVAVESVDRPDALVCKLIDFGLARSAVAPRERFIAGTPVYMSPEYLRNDVAPNTALDLWALAASAFEMLTGELPFPGDAASNVLEAIFFSPFPAAADIHADIPRSFDAWFARACAKDPAARFASAAELALALEEALP